MSTAERIWGRSEVAVELDVVLHLGAVRSADARAIRQEASEILKRTPEATHKLDRKSTRLNSSHRL